MRRRGMHHNRRGGTRVIAGLLSAVAVALIALALLDVRFRPMAEDIIAYQARLAAMRMINTAVMGELEAEDLAYGDMVRIGRGTNGIVTSVETDVIAVNRLKARVSDAVIRELEAAENRSVQLPLGTLFGNALTSGRGPLLEVRMIPAGYAQAEFYNEFTSAGINQTLHQIMLETSVQVVAVLPGYSVKTEASTRFCVAETVIVGSIPEGYTIVGEDGRSALTKAFDYRAE